MTGALDRPSQSTLETRKAEIEHVRVRRAWQSVHDGAMALLVARQRSGRRQSMTALSAELSVADTQERHTLRQKYAARRSALSQLASQQEREAARHQLAVEEAAELALLEEAQRGRRRARRRALMATLAERHRNERRDLQARQRHQRIIVAVMVGRPHPSRRRARGSAAPIRYQGRVEKRRMIASRRSPGGGLR